MSGKLLDALVEGGADIIELGVPFSDPLADGATVQATSQKALDNGTTLADCIELVRAFRERGGTIPILLMGYTNPFFQYGIERLARDAADSRRRRIPDPGSALGRERGVPAAVPGPRARPDLLPRADQHRPPHRRCRQARDRIHLLRRPDRRDRRARSVVRGVARVHRADPSMTDLPLDDRLRHLETGACRLRPPKSPMAWSWRAR